MPNFRSNGFIPLVVLAIVGTVSASGVTVVASQKSIPGDVLYPIKKVVQNVKVATALSEKDKAGVHLAIAKEKVREIEKLEEIGRVDKIVETAQSLEDSQEEALELVQVAKSEGENVSELTALLKTNLVKQQAILTKVSAKVPEQARQAMLESLKLLSEEASPTPCPSPALEDVRGVKISLSNSRSLNQLRNMGSSQNSTDDPCDSSNEENSAASSAAFDGGTESAGGSVVEGGADMGGAGVLDEDPQPQSEPEPSDEDRNL